MPLVSWLDETNNIKFPSSRFLESASYCRLKNVQIGYTFPNRWVGRIHAKSLRIYITGTNLLTITKYTGLDPEMHTSDNVKAENIKAMWPQVLIGELILLPKVISSE